MADIKAAVKAEISHALVVIHAFGDYVRGDIIKAKDEIEKILGGENASHVNKVAVDPAAAQ
jgi:hypothetical protein